MKLKRKTIIKMREIQASQIKDKIKELFLKANYHISPELMQQLKKII